MEIRINNHRTNSLAGQFLVEGTYGQSQALQYRKWIANVKVEQLLAKFTK